MFNKIHFMFCVVTFLSMGSIAQAKEMYLGMLRSAFPDARLSQRCAVCHSGVGNAMNLFGRDFSRLKRELGFNNMPEVWAQLRVLDSNGNGVSNEEELNQGLNPGLVPRPPAGRGLEALEEDVAEGEWLEKLNREIDADAAAILGRGAADPPALLEVEPAFTCTCHALDALYENACKFLPITQCGRVGNIVCIPRCQ